MKNVTRFMTAAALSAALMFAQGFRPRAAGGPGTPPDPATMVQMKVSRLTALLTLTSAQQTQATTIFTNEVTASESVMTSLKTDHDALASAIKTNNTAAIDQVASAMGTLQGQLTAIQAKANAAVYAILTADQQTKYDTMPHGGPGGPGPGFGPGFHGGPPPQ